jgi:hypothetical protein
MKKVTFGMLVLGLTTLGFSQESAEAIHPVELNNVTVSPANENYLYSVRDENTFSVVRVLQEKAAGYDVTKNAKFDNKMKDSFEVVFKATNGSIKALYNRDGKIISARENFKDVVLPMEVRKRAFERNEGWKMSGNQYVSLYSNDDLTTKVYKIKLINQNNKKNVIRDMLNNE